MYCQLTAESTEVETHLSIKLSKKNFGGILRPESVTRTLIKGLMHGPRAISSLIWRDESSGLCQALDSTQAPFTRYRIIYVSDSISCRIRVLFTRLRTNPILSVPEIRYNSLCKHSTPEHFLYRIHKK